MKLLECHVDNFGKLSNYDYRFSEGLTVIQEPNGFGKSTLAAFIKAMLYGFPRTAGRSVAGNERKKYLPWQGGTYGGSLDFEFDGTAYRVWRTFGKTAAKDTFKLLATRWIPSGNSTSTRLPPLLWWNRSGSIVMVSR